MSDFTPTCTRLCSNEDGSIDQECQQLCDAVIDCAITPNMVYTVVRAILDSRQIITTGLDEIIETEVVQTTYRIIFYQQLPWMLTFFIILLYLYWIDLIGGVGMIILVLAAFLVAAIFISFTFNDIYTRLSNIVSDILERLISDYDQNRGQYRESLVKNISQDLASSQVPCGCDCGNQRFQLVPIDLENNNQNILVCLRDQLLELGAYAVIDGDRLRFALGNVNLCTFQPDLEPCQDENSPPPVLYPAIGELWVRITETGSRQLDGYLESIEHVYTTTVYGIIFFIFQGIVNLAVSNCQAN